MPFVSGGGDRSEAVRRSCALTGGQSLARTPSSVGRPQAIAPQSLVLRRLAGLSPAGDLVHVSDGIPDTGHSSQVRVSPTRCYQTLKTSGWYLRALFVIRSPLPAEVRLAIQSAFNLKVCPPAACRCRLTSPTSTQNKVY